MAKHTFAGLSKHSGTIPQASSTLLDHNLRKNWKRTSTKHTKKSAPTGELKKPPEAR
jgi:hypothetical protein